MAAPSLSQLGPSVVGVVQWMLVGIEVLVLAGIVAWMGRDSRLGRALRRYLPLGRRTTLSVDASVAEVRRARPAKLVSMGGGSPQPVHGRHAEPGHREIARGGALRTARGFRTPPRPAATIGAEVSPTGSPLATLYCPGCGTALARGELPPRLVMRCAGCDRRVAMRLDGDRVVVALEG